MKLKKMLAGFVAAAMAVTTMAVSAFAATVELDSDSSLSRIRLFSDLSQLSIQVGKR